MEGTQVTLEERCDLKAPTWNVSLIEQCVDNLSKTATLVKNGTNLREELQAMLAVFSKARTKRKSASTHVLACTYEQTKKPFRIACCCSFVIK